LRRRTVNEAGQPVQRVIDETGDVIERTLNESGEVLEESPVNDTSDAGSEEEHTNEG